MNKKIIRTSNLAMRFYLNDGWTKQELDYCCIQGEVHCAHPDDDNPYYTLNNRLNSKFDVDKLLERTELILRAFDDQYIFTDRQLIEHFNW